MRAVNLKRRTDSFDYIIARRKPSRRSSATNPNPDDFKYSPSTRMLADGGQGEQLAKEGPASRDILENVMRVLAWIVLFVSTKLC